MEWSRFPLKTSVVSLIIWIWEIHFASSLNALEFSVHIHMYRRVNKISIKMYENIFAYFFALRKRNPRECVMDLEDQYFSTCVTCRSIAHRQVLKYPEKHVKTELFSSFCYYFPLRCAANFFTKWCASSTKKVENHWFRLGWFFFKSLLTTFEESVTFSWGSNENFEAKTKPP